MEFYCDKTFYSFHLIMGPKRPLSGASAEEQDKRVKKVMTVEKVKILLRLGSVAHVTMLVNDECNEQCTH